MSERKIGGAGRLTTGLPGSLERGAWLTLLAATVVTRLYELGHRVMSHDESLHVYYSWKLFAKGEYIHDPMMHGPVLYHFTALMYFLFGDNDFSARLFSAILGILLVLSPLLLRKWLGPVGALATGLMLFLSPTVMYYSRYIRHDIHVMLFTVMMIVGFIRYLDDRRGRWIVMAFAGGALNITSAEMSYIHGFVIVVTLGLFLVAERLRPEGGRLAGLMGLSLGLGLLIFSSLAKHGGLAEILPASMGARLPNFAAAPAKNYVEAGFLFAGLTVIFSMIVAMLAGFRASDPAEEREALADEGQSRGTGLVELLFPGQAPWFGLGGVALLAGGLFYADQKACSLLSASSTNRECSIANGLLAAGVVILLYGIASYFLAPRNERPLAWSMGRAPVGAVALALVTFGVIYTLFFTTFFSTVGKTSLQGIDGFQRSIQYWLAQHDVVRGDQPWYYYLLMVPMYEFLPFSFGMAAVLVYWRHSALRSWRGDDAAPGRPPALAASLFVPLCIAWMLGAYWIFSWAGEKMPWLVVHMAVPLSFLAGRLIADTVDCLDWQALRGRLYALTSLTTLAFAALAAWLVALMYYEQGWAILSFLLSLAVLALFGAWSVGQWRQGRQVQLGIVLALLAAFSLLGRQAIASEDAGTLLLGNYDHLITTLPRLLWAVVDAIGRSLVGLWPALQGADVGGAVRLVLGLAVLIGLLVALRRQGENLPRLSLRFFGALILALLLAGANLYVSLRANFVNEELATEYIVYAHATDDDNLALDRLRDLQKVLKDTQGRDAKIGYDNEVSWPLTWYFRNDADRKRPASVPFPGASYLGADAPGKAQLREYDAVLVGSPNYGKFEDYLDEDFVSYELDRMWWPNEGYKGITMDKAGLTKVLENVQNPNMRRNLMDILLYRRYVQDPRVPAAEAKAKSLDDWFHHAKMKLWVRKDIDQMGTRINAPSAPVGTAGPAPTKVSAPQLELAPELRLEGDGERPLAEPKGVKVDAEGRVYVLDHRNERVLIFDAEGKATGSLADGLLKYDPDGKPETADLQPSAWGLGVGPDGSVYIADTWNHRVLKFKDGAEVARVGTFGSPPSIGEALDLLYGPRDIAVDASGQVYVTDTGNKRVVILDADLKPLRAFGGTGNDAGELNEPTGIAIDPASGNIVVADLWNNRVQTFDKDLRPLRQFDVEAWTSTDANHKAYIAVGPEGVIAFTDPEKARVWFYSPEGQPLGRMGLPQDELGLKLPIGIAFDPQGRLYVASSEGNLVTRFPKPDFAAAAASDAVADGATPATAEAGSEAAGDASGAAAPTADQAVGDGSGAPAAPTASAGP